MITFIKFDPELFLSKVKCPVLAINGEKDLGELRKIQRTPTGTFFVCLPRTWANKIDLKKGALVYLKETSDKKIIIVW